jgi:plastocyanin
MVFMKRLHATWAGIALLGLLLALTSLAAAQDEEADTSADAPDRTVRLVDIVATDFKLEPANVTVEQGVVAFAIRNQGVIDHNVAIEDSRRQTIANSSTIAAGGFTTLNANLAPGTYTLVCTLPAHREAGMVGTLTVTP